MRLIDPKFLRRWVKHLKANGIGVENIQPLLRKAQKEGRSLSHEEFFCHLKETLPRETISQIYTSALQPSPLERGAGGVSSLARDAFFELDNRPKKRLIVRLKPDAAHHHECFCRDEPMRSPNGQTRGSAPTCGCPLCQCGALTTRIIPCRGEPVCSPYFAVGCLASDAESLCKHPDIEFAEKDAKIEHFAEQLTWGYTKIKAQDAYNFGLRGQTVKVAIIDTGVDYTHEELKDLYKGGYDFYNEDSNPMDDHWHGTHVAGILCARANDVGYRGVAPQIELYAVKVLSSDGSGYWSDVAIGIDWCRQNGIHIANMSLGGYEFSQAVKDACDAAKAAGVTLVAAAGNGGNWGWGISSVAYPAKFDSVLAVTAMQTFQNKDELAIFSSVGPEVDLTAPGSAIYSSVPLFKDPSGYMSANGTSMASPHVAGLAAIIKQAIPRATPSQIEQILEESADGNKFLPPGWENHPWPLGGAGTAQAPEKTILVQPTITGRKKISAPYIRRSIEVQNGRTNVPIGNPVRFTIKSDTWGINIETVKVKLTDSWGVNIYDSTSPYFNYSGDRFSYDVEVWPPQPWQHEEDVQVEVEAEDFMGTPGVVYEYIP